MTIMDNACKNVPGASYPCNIGFRHDQPDTRIYVTTPNSDLWPSIGCRANMLFLDGHVESKSAQELVPSGGMGNGTYMFTNSNGVRVCGASSKFPHEVF